MKRLAVVLFAVALTGCAAESAVGGTPSAASDNAATAIPRSSAASAISAASPATCAATDQDRYVYNPDRLEVLSPCTRVVGTVAAIRSEADGDLHILLELDAPYRHLLTPANQGEELGDLVVEPVCVRAVTQQDAIATCQADADPLRSLPPQGARIWMEGRYVLDLDHGSWAELHPLFRWGPLSSPVFTSTPVPAATATLRPVATPTPRPVAMSVVISSLTSPIARGSYATVAAKTLASAYCTIVVLYKSGPSTAAGLGPKTASVSGAVSWTWKVGTRTTIGSWPVTITCSKSGRSAAATTYMQVV